MELKSIYNQIKENLIKLDFNLIWPKFNPYRFALYNDKEVFLDGATFPIDNRFIGNTAIEYNGELLAIWNMSYEDDNVDIDLFTANIVHEMFHAFQREEKDSRFPNDLILLNYPDNLRNYSLKYQENVELVASLTSYEAFIRFMGIRKYRSKLISDIIKQEYKTETIEGGAEFAGMMALKQLSINKYQQRLDEYSLLIKQVNNKLFDIRRISYWVGTLFLISCVNNKIDVNYDLSDEISYFAQIQKDHGYVDIECDESISRDVEIAYTAYVQEKQVKFNEFINNHHNEVITNSYICGYDPMNMIKIENKILCTHFIMLTDLDTDEKKFIKGPLLLNLEDNSNNKVKSYIL